MIRVFIGVWGILLTDHLLVQLFAWANPNDLLSGFGGHDDATVRDLLAKVYDLLPAGGLLVISEPMGGGSRPDRAGDVYFAFYTMAMQTGRARSADEIAALCHAAGFRGIRSPRPARNYVTRVLTAQKPPA